MEILIGETIKGVVVDGDRALITTVSGKVIRIDITCNSGDYTFNTYQLSAETEIEAPVEPELPPMPTEEDGWSRFEGLMRPLCLNPEVEIEIYVACRFINRGRAGDFNWSIPRTPENDGRIIAYRKVVSNASI